MRFVVYGAGAIGGVIGGRLAQAGYDVVLIARGEHARLIAGRGLRLEDPRGSETLRLPVVESPAALGWSRSDVAVLAVKSQDTVGAAHDLYLAAGPRLPVVSAQNGVGNERTLARWFDDVYGMCVMCPAAHVEPGVVQAHSTPVTGLLDLGRFPQGVDGRAEQVAGALEAATFRAVARPDIMRWKHRKLVMNLGNAVQALCGPSEQTGSLGEILGLLEAEAEVCFAAAGIDPVSAEEDRARRGDLLQVQPIGERPRGGGSTWQSLQRRVGSVETDHLNGEIVLLGRLHGRPTPANALVQWLAARAAYERRPPGSLSHDALLEQLRDVTGAG